MHFFEDQDSPDKLGDVRASGRMPGSATGTGPRLSWQPKMKADGITARQVAAALSSIM